MRVAHNWKLNALMGIRSHSDSIVGRFLGLGRAATALVYPKSCLICRTFEIELDASICVECRSGLRDARSAASCPRCAGPIGPYGAATGFCQKCRNRTLRVGGTVRVAMYDGVFAALIRAWKYHGQERLAAPLGMWLVEQVRASSWADRIEAVVPVPTHWLHRLGRPLYAAETLATATAKRMDRPCVPLLRRVRAGPHQIGLTYTQRQANVRGAFAVARGVRINQARVLLIDDVRTTGATLEECARILLKAGCADVYAAVAATAGGTPTGQPITLI